MRNAALALLFFVAFGFAANSQKFNLVPQVGFESSKSFINYNDKGWFSPLDAQFSPQASLRMNYAGRKGHGFYFGLAGSRAGINYKFTDPETGRQDYQAVNGDMQFRLEGGYLYNSKPIFFKKSGSGNTDKLDNESKSSTASRKNCLNTSKYCIKSSSNSSRCGNGSKTEKSQKSRGAWMRIQPSAGIGYSPFADNDILAKSSNGQTYYEYEEDGWNSALITGVAFEFGHKNRSLISLSFNYFKSLGNSGVKTLNTVSGTKTTTTTLDSKSAGWNIRVGIPFALDKQKVEVKKKPESIKRTGCNYYRIQYRCRQSI